MPPPVPLPRKQLNDASKPPPGPTPTKSNSPPPCPPPMAPLLHPSHGVHATDNNGQACMVTYMYGAAQANGSAQASALAALAARTPFDPRSLDLPSIPALAGFYHACLGFPVKQTWLDAIKAGNFDSFNGLTYSNAARYCPDADETIMGHLAQQCQNIRSTKPKSPTAPPSPSADPETPSNLSKYFYLTGYI